MSIVVHDQRATGDEQSRLTKKARTMKLVGHERLMSVQQTSKIRQMNVITLTDTQTQTDTFIAYSLVYCTTNSTYSCFNVLFLYPPCFVTTSFSCMIFQVMFLCLYFVCQYCIVGLQQYCLLCVLLFAIWSSGHKVVINLT